MDTLPVDRARAIRAIKILLFSASVVPALVGGAVAAAAGSFAWTPFVVAAAGLFIGQMGGDYLYFHRTAFHTDARDAHTKIFAGWRPLFTGTLLAPERTVWAGVACLALDLAIAAWFAVRGGPEVLWFAAAGGAVAIFFTPLMLLGLKEPVIFVTFGPLSVAGVAWALTGRVPMAALAASLPVGVFVTVVAYLKSARFELAGEGGDEVVLRLSRTVVIVLYALGYACHLAGVAVGWLPPWTLLAFLTLPLAWTVVTAVGGGKSLVSAYHWATVRSILVLVGSGVGIASGFLLSS